MRKVWLGIGVVAFWAAWPGLWVYFKLNQQRTRLLIVCDGEFLVLRRWLGAGGWHLPGGGLHHKEETTKGLLREVQEETGLTLTEPQISYAYEGTNAEFGLKFTYTCCVCELSQKPVVTIQKGEIVDYSWQRLAAPTLPLAEPTARAVAWWQNKG